MGLSVLTGLLGVLVGILFGNRLVIGRDKRKEFNEATSECREIIRNVLSDPKNKVYFRYDKLEPLSEYFSGYEKIRFNKAVSRYKEVVCREEFKNGLSYVTEEDFSERFIRLKEIQPLIKRK